MKVKYKILRLNPDQHSVVVRFYTDKITEEMLVSEFDSLGQPALDELGKIFRCSTDVNIQITTIPTPVGEELDRYIMRYAPRETLAFQEKLLDPSTDTSMGALAGAVGTEREFNFPSK